MKPAKSARLSRTDLSQVDPDCIVFVDEEARSGQDNMELDRQALEFVSRAGDSCKKPLTICRLYTWKTPTVTLGYFQDAMTSHSSELGRCPQVKRLTGGGAILHDCELTYSIAIPAQHSIRNEPRQLYEVVHNAIIRILAQQGIESSLRMDSPEFQTQNLRFNGEQNPAREGEPFLCFLRQDDRDIVVGRHKIVGSAQRRRKGNILQHGSILLKASALTPEVLGLEDLDPGYNDQTFRQQLPQAIGSSVSCKVDVVATSSKSAKLEQLIAASM